MKTSIPLRQIITLLTPMLLTATGGDRDQAEAAAIQTVNAYAARHPIELLLVAQSIAFGIATLSSVGLSMAENIPIQLMLRLRGNAASLSRGSENSSVRSSLMGVASFRTVTRPPACASYPLSSSRQ